MRRVRNVFKNRVLLTVLGVATVWCAFAFAQTTPAYACRRQQVEITYYTDATRTVACGGRILGRNCA